MNKREKKIILDFLNKLEQDISQVIEDLDDAID